MGGVRTLVVHLPSNCPRSCQAELLFVRVILVVPSEDYFFKRIQVEEGSSAHRTKTATEAALAEITGELKAQGVPSRGEVIIVDKTEAEAIAGYAAEHECDGERDERGDAAWPGGHDAVGFGAVVQAIDAILAALQPVGFALGQLP